MQPIRNSAKAIIISQGSLLVIAKRAQEGVYYILPGGGQHPGETLHQTLVRECIEEIGAQIMLGDLLFIREYIGRHHEFAAADSHIHQIEFLFACALREGETPRVGALPDEGQCDIAWLPVHELERSRLYPAVLRCLLKEGVAERGPVYLGDVN